MTSYYAAGLALAVSFAGTAFAEEVASNAGTMPHLSEYPVINHEFVGSSDIIAETRGTEDQSIDALFFLCGDTPSRDTAYIVRYFRAAGIEIRIDRDGSGTPNEVYTAQKTEYDHHGFIDLLEYGIPIPDCNNPSGNETDQNVS